jgi:hypothetical protein
MAVLSTLSQIFNTILLDSLIPNDDSLRNVKCEIYKEDMTLMLCLFYICEVKKSSCYENEIIASDLYPRVVNRLNLPGSS